MCDVYAHKDAPDGLLGGNRSLGGIAKMGRIRSACLKRPMCGWSACTWWPKQDEKDSEEDSERIQRERIQGAHPFIIQRRGFRRIQTPIKLEVGGIQEDSETHKLVGSFGQRIQTPKGQRIPTPKGIRHP